MPKSCNFDEEIIDLVNELLVDRSIVIDSFLFPIISKSIQTFIRDYHPEIDFYDILVNPKERRISIIK